MIFGEIGRCCAGPIFKRTSWALGEIAILDYKIEGSNASIMPQSFNFLITKIQKFIRQNKTVRCDFIL